MPQIIRIDIKEAPRFIMQNGEVCYGDSDLTTLYDPQKDIVYLCRCPKCKRIVKPDDINCPDCDADLLK